MRTIERHNQIDQLLKFVDQKATETINKGLKFTIEFSDNGITESQFNAQHVWFRWCAEYLNKKGFYRYHSVSGRKIPWTETDFKNDVYKRVLKVWKKKASTKDQDTKDPEDVRLAITGHLAAEYGDIILPEWPSNRG